MSTETLTVRQSVSISRTITEQDVDTFAELSLDRNLIHFDDKFASKTIFGKRIAHGMIGAALISGALTELMGSGNIWLSAEIKFEKPIFIGDKLTSCLTIREINRRGVASIDVRIDNERGETVISGSVQSMRTISKA